MGRGREHGRMHTVSSTAGAEALLGRGRRTAIAPPRVVVLCSSADEDEKHLGKLLTHLRALEETGVLRVWHPGKVLGGDLRARRVRDEIDRAAVVLLLVSPDFIVSEDFRSNVDLLADAASLAGTELAAAPEPVTERQPGMTPELAEEAGPQVQASGRRVVVPIVVRKCLHDTTELRGLQALPRDGRPVAQAGDPDQIWTDVAQEIRRMLPAPEEHRVFDLEPEDPRWRERVRQVARIAGLRFPEAEVRELPAARPFAGLVVVTMRTELAENVEPMGVLDGPMTEDALTVFQEEVERPYREDEPLLRARIVHGGEAVPMDLYRRARRAGVEIESFASYQKLVDFQRYLDWQGQHIARDPAYPESLYVDQRAELRIRLDREETVDVLGRLVELLEDPYPRIVLVLGDFGTGKTFLLRQIARTLARRHLERPGEVAPPVLVEMRALEKSGGLDALLAQHFQRPGGAEISVAKFRYLLSEGRSALLFDGFDELAVRVTYDSVLEHLQTVLDAAQGKAKVVVTSRTAHFLNDQGVELALARKVAEREGYRLIKLHPFDEAQIRAALGKRLGSEEAAERRMGLLREVEDLMGLSANPRMLGFILEIPTADLEEAKERKGRITSATLYELLVTKWLEGEAKIATPGAAKPELTLDELWRVVTDLALFAWGHTEKRIRKEHIPAELWANLERMDPSRRVDVGTAEVVVGSRSLLIRDDEGRFSFWHESILDWLVARASATELAETGAAAALGKKAMSDLMSDFFAAMAGKEAAVAWARAALTGGSDVAIQNANRVLRRIGVEAEVEGAIDVTLDLSGHDLRGQDLSGSTHLRGAILEGANLTGATLVGADLSGGDLCGASLLWANAERVKLQGANLEQADLWGARLLHADFRGARFSKTRLRYARLIGADMDPEILRTVGNSRAAAAGVDLWGAAPPQPICAEPVTLGPLSQLRSLGNMGLAISPDGALLALGDAAGGIVLWDLGTRKALHGWAGAMKAITSLAFSPDGRTLASSSLDNTVRLWDPHSHSAIASLQGHSSSVQGVAFSPDGRTLASASFDNTVRLWDPHSHSAIASLEGHSNWVWGVAFSPDGRTLASASDDKTVRLWDPHSYAPLAALRGHSSSVWSVAFSPDGRTLASASLDNTVRLWDPRARAPIASLRGHSGSVWSVAFAPDGRTLASASEDNTVRLWDPRTRTPIASLQGHSKSVLSVAFSPDGRTLASGSLDNTLRLWAHSHAPIASLQGHSHSVHGVAFSSNGRALATASKDSTIRLWDDHSHSLLASLRGHSKSVNSVAYSPDGRTLASASEDSTVRLWDSHSYSPLVSLYGHSSAVLSVAYSPDGRTLASASRDKTVRLWDPHSHSPLASLQGHSSSVLSVAFSPDGRTLASASRDKTVRLWDPHSHSPIASLQGHSNEVLSVAFSPDGRRLASASDDNSVRLWDPHSHSLLTSLKGHSHSVWSVAFSPDGRTLASASSDKTVRLWDPHSHSLLTSLQGHSSSVLSVAFSPDGRTLASASLDNTIRLWDVAAAKCLVVFVPAEQGWAAFSPDGRYKVHGDIHGLFWHVVGLCRFEPGELDDHLDAFTEHPPRRLRLDEPF